MLLAEKDPGSALGQDGRCHASISGAATDVTPKDLVPVDVSLSRDAVDASRDVGFK